MSPMEFAATVGFDAFRIAMGGKPRVHDVDTICRWLRHVSAGTGHGRPSSESVVLPKDQAPRQGDGR